MRCAFPIRPGGPGHGFGLGGAELCCKDLLALELGEVAQAREIAL